MRRNQTVLVITDEQRSELSKWARARKPVMFSERV
jgi:RNA polymerase subunit RPABC4/transcription elongation factor Spt4